MNASVPSAVAFRGVATLRTTVYAFAGVLALALIGGVVLLVITLWRLGHTQDALRESEGRLQAVVDNSPAAISLQGDDGCYLLINRHFEALFDVARWRVVGESDDAWLPAGVRARFRNADAEVRATGTQVEVEATLHVGGVERTYWIVTFPVLRDDGHTHAIGRSATDITEQKAAEAKLLQAVQEAERANVAKSEFLSRMSHELRMPLNAILGFTQVLELTHVDADQRSSIQHVLRGGKHLLDLINEVLDLARIEAGRLAISIEPVNANEVAAAAVELITPLAQQNSIIVTVDAGHHFVMADQQRLHQVLLNLIANAVKYNRPGGTVRVLFQSPAPGRTRILVSDTGPGIHPENLGKLFKPFVRLGAEAGTIEGTGLGLALSRRLMEAMLGTIAVASVPGQGTTLTLELPEAANPLEAEVKMNEPAELAPRDSMRAPRTVLYIEDNVSNLKLMERILSHRPHITLTAANHAALGIELAQSRHPDMILLDVNLPDMSGSEVVFQLRASAATKDIPIVVVSADATDVQIKRLLSAGARAYITKPYDVRKLLETIDRTLYGDLVAERTAVPGRQRSSDLG